MKRRCDLIFFFLSPIFLNLAFAPFPFRFFSYFSLIPLFYLIEKSPTKKALFYSFLFYFLFALFHLWWLYFLVVPILGITKFLLYIGILVLFLYFGLYGLVFGFGVKKLGIFTAPFLWAILEFVRTKSEIGFPWGLLGYTQMLYLPLIQFASLTGVYGVSAFVVLVNLIIHKLIFLPTKKRIGLGVSLLFIFLIPLSYGLVRIKRLGGYFKVAIIQPNVSPYEKGEAESAEEILNSLFQLTNRALAEKPDILIYPETASLFDLTKDNWLREEFTKISNLRKVYILIGTPIYEGNHYYNGAVLFVPEKGIGDIYRKIHPVPFSERIPYIDRFPIFRPFATADMGNFTPGKKFTIFSTPLGKLACLICFESIFPDLTREFGLKGADFLVNITNDGWFGKTVGPYQHCELALMRSVELGKPLLRSANNGISLICDAYGRVIKRTDLFTKEILFALCPKSLPSTIYQKFGDWFILFSSGIVILTVGKKILKLRRK